MNQGWKKVSCSVFKLCFHSQFILFLNMFLCPCFFSPHFIYYTLSRALISPHPAMITGRVLCQGFKHWWTIPPALIISLLFACCLGGDEKQIHELPRITPRQGCSAVGAGPCSEYRGQTWPWDEFMGSHLGPDGDPQPPVPSWGTERD